jgi:hypothetical protein
METEFPLAPAWKQPFPTGGHGNGMESISTYFGYVSGYTAPIGSNTSSNSPSFAHFAS